MYDLIHIYELTGARGRIIVYTTHLLVVERFYFNVIINKKQCKNRLRCKLSIIFFIKNIEILVNSPVLYSTFLFIEVPNDSVDMSSWESSACSHCYHKSFLSFISLYFYKGQTMSSTLQLLKLLIVKFVKSRIFRQFVPHALNYVGIHYISYIDVFFSRHCYYRFFFVLFNPSG